MTLALTVDIPVATDEDCTACAQRLRDELAVHRGVTAIEPSPADGKLRVSYDPELCSLDCVSHAADELRVDLAERYVHEVLEVSGMDCADCARTIERGVARLPGVSYVAVSFPAARISVEYTVGLDTPAAVVEQIRRLGYTAMRPGGESVTVPWWRRREAITGAAAALMFLAITLDAATGLPHAAIVGISLAAIVIGCRRIARAGLAALRATHRPEMNLLMTIAVIGAMAIGAWVEASLVVVLFSLGDLLEGRAVDRARRELAGLVSLAPDVARVRDLGGEEREVPAASLAIGDLVVVRPGERIAADGTTAEGASAVDQAPITGESTPVDKQAGDGVFAGTLNGQGALIVRVTTAPGDTTIAKIGRLVAEAQARKSPSERWVTSFAAVYTPVVMAASLLVAVVPLAFGVAFADAVYSALALLILACPCALVISTPVSIVSALGRASSAGVLIKGGAHLERAAEITTVAFDKTGTLTEGRPALAAVKPLAAGEDELLTVAASLEQGSEHPLARAIVAAARERGLALTTPTDFTALTGLGARASLEGTTVTIGNPRLFGEDTLPAGAADAVARLRACGQTAVLVARDGAFLGALGLADRPRAQAAEAVAALQQLGIARVVLLTGDSAAVAAAVAAELGVSETRAELLPQDKADAIGALGSGVAMVGDGVNDAPALAAADLGIAMGSAGSDTAIEVADIALMGDEPVKVAGLIGLARWTKAVVRQNVAFSLGVKGVALVVLAAGALPLWAAVASDVGASLIVIVNALRLLRGAPHGRLRDMPLLGPAAHRPDAPPPVGVGTQTDDDCSCCADEPPASVSGPFAPPLFHSVPHPDEEDHA